MCTAVTLRTKDFYFGRNLDHPSSYSEEVTVTPRNFPLPFRHRGTLESHYAMIGMAHVLEDYPLYFDGVNEKGLAIAGLNFPGRACYGPPCSGKENIASFELIPWLLGQCSSVGEARERLAVMNLTDTPFSPALPPAQLHWLLADRKEAVTVEAVAEGIRVYDNPVGELTNNPPFPEQLFRLNDYMHLSPRQPENRFCEALALKPYSTGMGAMGLPGDLSSQSRFVRAAFMKANSVCPMGEGESVGQFFHILDGVSQIRGCSDLGNGQYEMTLYSACCNADKGIYYYTTYGNRRISAVNMYREKLDEQFLVRYSPVAGEQLFRQNG